MLIINNLIGNYVIIYDSTLLSFLVFEILIWKIMGQEEIREKRYHWSFQPSSLKCVTTDGSSKWLNIGHQEESSAMEYPQIGELFFNCGTFLEWWAHI